VSWKQDLTLIFPAFRPVKRGDDDDTLSMFQNTFIDMVKAAIQNVTNTKVDDSSRQLCNSLKKKKKIKNLRKRDIKSRWKRNQPGQRSDEVIDKCICLTLADIVPHQFLNLGTGEGEALPACYLNYV